MNLAHPGLRELLNINQYLDNHRVGFLTLETPLAQWFISASQKFPYIIGLQLRRQYRHVSVGLQALKLKEVDSIYVMEIYNQHLLFLLPLLQLTGKKIFLGLHGNQTLAQENIVKELGFRFLKRYLAACPQMKAVLLELDDHLLPESFQLPSSAKIVIPHPMIGEVTPRLQKGERLPEGSAVKIGIVGMVRSDKPIGQLLEKLVDYGKKSQNCEIVVGIPKEQTPQWIRDLGVTILDTTEDEDYFNVLRSLDILVTYYDPERYFYRASGVISDAGSCGCYIIAPDYPLIKNQITWPVGIGSIYSSLDEIEPVLDQGIDHVRAYGQDNHWQWREKRNAEYIAQLLL